MKKCPFCGRALLASADFCPFCTSLLKEKTPITFSEKSGASKKLIISCISVALAFCVALFAVGNIKPSDNSNIILPTVSDNADKNTDTNLNGGVSTPPLLSEPDNNKKPIDNNTSNNQKPTDNTDDTTATPQGPSEDKKTETDNGGNGNQSSSNSSETNNSGNNSNTEGNNSSTENSINTGTGSINSGTGSNISGGSSGTSTPSDNLPSMKVTTPTGGNSDILQYLTYTIGRVDASPDVYVQIKKCSPSLSGAIAVPATIEGYPVKIIETEAFMGCDKITSIYLPDSVTYLGMRAFKNCTALESVRMPPKSEYFGDSVFEGCTSLKTISLKSVSVLRSSTFKGCTSLEYVEIGPYRIDGDSFRDCKNLKAIKFFAHTTAVLIVEDAFTGCTSLTDIYAPFEKSRVEDLANNYIFFNANFHTY